MRLSAWTAQLRRNVSGGEPLATLCPIYPARESNPKPPVLLAMSLTLRHLAGVEKSAHLIQTREL